MRRFLPAVLACSLPLLALACGGGTERGTGPETVEGTIAQQTVAEGNPGAGKEVYDTANPGCGTCHTFEPAGSTGTVGPDLDDALQGMDRQQIFDAIVNPDAEIAEGFQPGVMPKDYGQKLSEKQLADLVAFLEQG